jgi:serine/threonine protein kinase
MAPEQLNGRAVDARTDIFALGAVIHEVVTGRKAFAAKTMAAIVNAVLHESPPAASRVQPLSPPAACQLSATPEATF